MELCYSRSDLCLFGGRRENEDAGLPKGGRAKVDRGMKKVMPCWMERRCEKEGCQREERALVNQPRLQFLFLISGGNAGVSKESSLRGVSTRKAFAGVTKRAGPTQS